MQSSNALTLEELRRIREAVDLAIDQGAETYDFTRHQEVLQQTRRTAQMCKDNGIPVDTFIAALTAPGQDAADLLRSGLDAGKKIDRAPVRYINRHTEANRHERRKARRDPTSSEFRPKKGTA